MILVTKIFHFEAAHAIYGYEGACKDIHGHSYELHVTVAGENREDDYIASPGILLDFRELKRIVHASVISKLDHRLLLSDQYIRTNEALALQENHFILQAEPTAENLLLYIYHNLENELPADVQLMSLKLYETKDSYAEWYNKFDSTKFKK